MVDSCSINLVGVVVELSPLLVKFGFEFESLLISFLYTFRWRCLDAATGENTPNGYF